MIEDKISLDATKLVFRVLNKARSVSLATEFIARKLKFTFIKFRYETFKKLILKLLISLCGCAGWSGPYLFANPEDRFSRVEAQIILKQSTTYIYTLKYTIQEQSLCNNMKVNQV